jgi:hypothetical protein
MDAVAGGATPHLKLVSGAAVNVSALVDAIGQHFTPWSATPRADNTTHFSYGLAEAVHECNTLDHTVGELHNGLGLGCDCPRAGIGPRSSPLFVLFGGARIRLSSHWGFNASQCYLLLTWIRLCMNQLDEAEGALDRAVSYDFPVRSSVCYRLISAEYQRSTAEGSVKLTVFLSRCSQKSEKINDALLESMKRQTTTRPRCSPTASATSASKDNASCSWRRHDNSLASTNTGVLAQCLEIRFS